MRASLARSAAHAQRLLIALEKSKVRYESIVPVR